MNYRAAYFKLIRYRKENPLPQDHIEYTELHHIIPRSLGGNDEPKNLVRLTAREHFIAHILLFKAFKKRSNNPILAEKDKQNNSLRNMAAAYLFMQHRTNHNSRLYSKARTEAINANKTYSMDKLKDMFEFYRANDCGRNHEKYQEFQQEFNYPYKIHTLRRLFQRNGFILQDRKISNLKILAMYADYSINKSEYNNSQGYTNFQKKWGYEQEKEQLEKMFYYRKIAYKKYKHTFHKAFLQKVLDIENQLSVFSNGIHIDEWDMTEYKKRNIKRALVKIS